LKNRLEQDKDKHQHEIVAIQENYKQKLTLTNAYEEEIDLLKKKIQQLEADLEKFKSEKKEEETTTSSAAIPSSSKSDDGWCLNGNCSSNSSI
jgi:phage shock protein A